MENALDWVVSGGFVRLIHLFWYCNIDPGGRGEMDMIWMREFNTRTHSILYFTNS